MFESDFGIRIRVCVCLLSICFAWNQEVKANNTVDSLKHELKIQATHDSSYAMTCWYLARFYDEHNQFDSMQYWINAGIERLPVNKVQLIHFHYAAFQSIAYYYNGLLQMDLYESMHVLRIAKVLKDSVLLTTGYNFMGLANSNIGEYKTAIPYFYEGMKYARQPPFDAKYLVASKPHHLYGNLAEAYFKNNQLDSALFNAKESLKLAMAIHSKRGMAVAKNLLGLIYSKKNEIDSAFYYQQQAYTEGLNYHEEDVSLIACASLARIFYQNKRIPQALSYLNKGFLLKEKNPDINFYFTKQFLDEAMLLYNEIGSREDKMKCLAWSLENNERINKITDQQVVKIILNGIKNENRANHLALTESEQKRKITSMQFIIALIAFLATGVILVLYMLYSKRRLKEISLRQQISRDLHDDINATLSSIKLYSELSAQEQEKNNPYALTLTQKITSLSADLMSRIGDVIFVLKHNYFTGEKITNRLKTMAHDLLIPKEIIPVLKLEPKALNNLVKPTDVKNILLIIKEALNNVAKYSEANTCTLSIYESQSILYIAITDDGIGLPINYPAGNGIQNMKFRCEELKGTFKIQSDSGRGTTIQCSFKLPFHSL